MSTRRPRTFRPYLEDLEGRLVPSATPITSTNWSGYAVVASPGAVTAVSGTWTVPKVTGPARGSTYAAEWVGIDGANDDGSVEQTGTLEEVVNGKATYFAWYEMYPSPFVTITSITVQPGDSITASVSYSTSSKLFTLSLTDNAQPTFSTTQSAPGVQRSTAEWVVEAPANIFGPLPLADFGTVNFSNAQATIAGNSNAEPINYPWPNTKLYQINMTSSPYYPQRGVLEDTTSALDSTGTSFSVTWDSSGTNTRSSSLSKGSGRLSPNMTSPAGDVATTTSMHAVAVTTAAPSQSALVPLVGLASLPGPMQSPITTPPLASVSSFLMLSFRPADSALPERSPVVLPQDDGTPDQFSIPRLRLTPNDAGTPGQESLPRSGSDPAPSPVPDQPPVSPPGIDLDGIWASDLSFRNRVWEPAAPLKSAGPVIQNAREDGTADPAGMAYLLALGGTFGIAREDAESRQRLRLPYWRRPKVEP